MLVNVRAYYGNEDQTQLSAPVTTSDLRWDLPHATRTAKSRECLEIEMSSQLRSAT